MPAKNKQIEEGIRTRFIESVEQIRAAGEETIEDIMKNLGDYQQSFTQMKAGTRYPTLKNVVLLCQCYGVNANWLLFGIGGNGIDNALNPLKRLHLLEQEMEQLKMIFGKRH